MKIPAVLPLGSMQLSHMCRRTQYACEDFIREENLTTTSLQYNRRGSQFPDIVPICQNGGHKDANLYRNMYEKWCFKKPIDDVFISASCLIPKKTSRKADGCH